MQYFSGGKYPIPQTMIVLLCEVIKLLGTIIRSKCKFDFLMYLFVKYVYTAVAVRKTWVLHTPIKNRPTLAYKNIVRKCYEDMFFITNIHFNNPTSSPQT